MLSVVGEQRGIAVFPRKLTLGGLAEDAGDAGVGVLDVVDRVVAGCALGELHVEVHLALGGAGQEKVAAGIAADFLDQVCQRDDLAGALGRTHDIAAVLERHELGDQDRQAVIDNAPKAGEAGYESLIRFHGALSSGFGAAFFWWLLAAFCQILFYKSAKRNESEGSESASSGV